MVTVFQQKPFLKWLIYIAAIFLLFAILVFSASSAYAYYYRDKFYPNTFIAGIDVSRKNIDEVKQIINEKVDRINQSGITFKLYNKSATIYPVLSAAQGDLAIPIIAFDPEKTVNEAFVYCHNSNFWKNWPAIFTYFSESRFLISYTLLENEIRPTLENQFNGYNIKTENAKLIYTTDEYGSLSFSVEKERIGEKINFDKGLMEMKNRIALLDTEPITLESLPDEPEIKKADCLNVEPKAQQLINFAPLTLVHDRKDWLINKNILVSWLSLAKSDNENDKVDVIIDQAALEAYLSDNIAKEIDREPQDARFEMKDGKITEFQVSKDGLKLDLSASALAIEQAAESRSTTTITLIAEKVESTVDASDLNNMGIKENIGIGRSNFKGSPANRRHNIKNGANRLNGILIKPDEEFSLVKTLGKIDKDTGYLPELVIKGNKTIPEYGGGLCQIGTTMFRAGLDTGLPITQRRNHSYRVQYYEPAGTDATIYDPAPDLRFINDTGNHILVQTRIEGDEVIFEFWGTQDGRIIEKSDPVISKIVKPGPTKLVETLDLKPGEKKCTESAHNGADAYFDYKVTYASGEIKEKRFNSHYIPWRAVCLIGVEKLTEPATTASSSTEVIAPTSN